MRRTGFDLHTHTTASDGLLRPTRLVERARGLVAGLAITDHDSVAGLTEALTAGEEGGVVVLPGVEFTTDYGQYEVHILGYLFDFRHPGLADRLGQVVRGRVVRVKRILSKLAELGFSLSWEDVHRHALGSTIGRPHVMRALIAAGLVRRSEADRFFQAYLVRGAPAFVPHEEMTVEEAIGLALTAGGAPVLAHPGRIGTDSLLPRLVAMGLVGLEAYHPRHRPEETIRYLRLAQEYGLVSTGGSDFHGEPGGSPIGQATAPVAAVEALARRAPSQAGQAFLSALHTPNSARE